MEAEKRRTAPEAQIQERPQMGEKELYCLGWHFKNFFDQAADGKSADFGAPCATCKYAALCKFDWREMREQLEAATGISVAL
mgnify:CR=1 FL=1